MKLSDFICCNLVIEQDCEFDAFMKLGDHFDGRAVTFVENEKYIGQALGNKNVVGVIICKALGSKIKKSHLGIAYSSSPKASFIRMNNMMTRNDSITRIGINCNISSTAKIHPKGVVIGDNVTIEDNVMIHAGTVIGSNSFVGRYSDVGSNCYERCLDENGNHVIATHNGGVLIGNDVIIEQGVVIDRALFIWDNTEIADQCYIGRDSGIAHGCKINEGAYIYPRAVLCGNVTVGRHSKIGIGAIVSNRIQVGEYADIKLGSIVTKNVDNNEAVSGNFAIPHSILIEAIKKLVKR
ncbi:MAG: hypothetical protein HDQ88_11525 [Clostridia bacterium]|nr:hypothetical protein [Clostridia bacterium]